MYTWFNITQPSKRIKFWHLQQSRTGDHHGKLNNPGTDRLTSVFSHMWKYLSISMYVYIYIYSHIYENILKMVYFSKYSREGAFYTTGDILGNTGVSQEEEDETMGKSFYRVFLGEMSMVR